MTIDFKGWWKTTDGARCEPLTVRDAFSKYILLTKVMSSPQLALVRAELDALFSKHGKPRAIQCDNGSPFISMGARGGLTRLSAWWVSLGIEVVRSRPGCPQDNGAHERMHRDMRIEVQAHAGKRRRNEQRALERWRQEFNHVRPHEALKGKVPAELYKPARPRRDMKPIVIAYPRGWLRRKLDSEGKIYICGERYRVSRSLAGHTIARQRRSDVLYHLWFHEIDLGQLEAAPGADEISDIWTQAKKTKRLSRGGSYERASVVTRSSTASATRL